LLEVVDDPSSLPPHPDGIVYVRNLARECCEAGNEFTKALQREIESVTRRDALPESRLEPLQARMNLDS
jgi:hypothetical protein